MKDLQDLQDQFTLFMEHADWKKDKNQVQNFVGHLLELANTRGKLSGLMATQEGITRIKNMKHEPPINECVQAFLERYESAFLDFSSQWEATKLEAQAEKSRDLNLDR